MHMFQWCSVLESYWNFSFFLTAILNDLRPKSFKSPQLLVGYWLNQCKQLEVILCGQNSISGDESNHCEARNEPGKAAFTGHLIKAQDNIED
jgi:hypothetical protein